MDKSFEVEMTHVSGSSASNYVARVERRQEVVSIWINTGAAYYVWNLLPSEAVTIGEQLIAAGKAGE